MTALADILARRIATGGPINMAEYMAECLMHPVHGYYPTRDPLGAAGDFTTAPEISQIFGEVLALALAQCWLDQGRPTPFTLAELGPGRGTLMADIMHTIRAVPGMAEAARIHLVETSPTLRKRQAQALDRHSPSWHDTIATLPDAPLFLVANEFFDALPIRQFQRRGLGWSERLVGFDAGRLAPGFGPVTPYPALSQRLADTKDGDVVEFCPSLPAIAGEVGQRIAQRGGVAIVIDYGGWHSLGDTLQALAGHAPADPFDAPGAADLTAHVDFEALHMAFAASGAAATGMVTQGILLERLGITVRAQKLAQGLTGTERETHIAAHRRLTHPEEMGQLFKAIAVTAADSPPPPGFEPIS